MSDIIERLLRVGTERQRTSAHDDPGHYLHVVAKISNADGKMMLEAAQAIQFLAARYDDAMKRITDMQAELEHLRREVNR